MCSIISLLTETPPLALQGEPTLLTPEPNFQSKEAGSVPTHQACRQGSPGKAVGREGKGRRRNHISLNSLLTVGSDRAWLDSRGAMVWLSLQNLYNSPEPYQL